MESIKIAQNSMDTIPYVIGINQHIINISKLDSLLINEFLFKPSITKYVNAIYIHSFLNFPYNWTSWKLPKKLLKKDCNISFFDKTKIVVNW